MVLVIWVWYGYWEPTTNMLIKVKEFPSNLPDHNLPDFFAAFAGFQAVSSSLFWVMWRPLSPPRCTPESIAKRLSKVLQMQGKCCAHVWCGSPVSGVPGIHGVVGRWVWIPGHLCNLARKSLWSFSGRIGSLIHSSCTSTYLDLNPLRSTDVKGPNSPRPKYITLPESDQNELTQDWKEILSTIATSSP